MTAPALVTDLAADIGAIRTAPSARVAWRVRRTALFHIVFAPPPKLAVDEWADSHRMLSREASAEHGKWRTDRFELQRGIMAAFSEPGIEEVVVMSAAQLVKTEALLNVVGFYIDQDPAPILIVYPTEAAAKKFSLKRLAPMLRDTPRLRGKVRDAKSRDSGNTILDKNYTGGHLTMVGANAPTGLASLPIRIVLFDEVDRYPASAGTEGDPVALGRQRAENFWNRKLGYFSTPGIKNISRIEKEWERSDQRRYFVACPHCQHEQHLVWEQLHWEKTEVADAIGAVVKVHHPETAHYVCAGCGCVIDETEKSRMVRGGRWIATRPNGGRVAGFHVNALYSPWVRWAKLAADFLAAKDSEDTLKAFVNLKLGLPFEPKGEVDLDSLKARAEDYAAEVPMGVGLLTAAVDVQGDRLEVMVRGWGAAQESWLIAHHRLYGDPEQDEVWKELDTVLFRGYRHAGGALMTVRATLIDSGYKKSEVYQYVRTRQRRNVFASKGASERTSEIVRKSLKANADGIRLVLVGTVAVKDRLFARLKRRTHGAGSLHFPTPKLPDRPDDERRPGAPDAEYFAQLLAERPAIVKNARGYHERIYEKIAERNEATDLEVGALAALHLLGAPVRDRLEVWVTRVQAEGARLRAGAEADAAPVPEGEEPPDDAPPPPREAPRPASPLRPTTGLRLRKPGSGWISGR
jgi:phage terminase large subunit GpA-like protein